MLRSSLHSKKKAEIAAEEDQEFSIHTRGSDVFGDFVTAKQVRDSSQQQLAELISDNEWQLDSADTLLVVTRCLKYKNVPGVVIKTTEEDYESHGIVLDYRNAVMPLSWEDENLVEPQVDKV